MLDALLTAVGLSRSGRPARRTRRRRRSGRPGRERRPARPACRIASSRAGVVRQVARAGLRAGAAGLAPRLPFEQPPAHVAAQLVLGDHFEVDVAGSIRLGVPPMDQLVEPVAAARPLERARPAPPVQLGGFGAAEPVDARIPRAADAHQEVVLLHPGLYPRFVILRSTSRTLLA